jgi:hydrogenase/urease accessory protein HupE
LPRLREIADEAFEIDSRGGKLVSTNATVQLDNRNGITIELAFAIPAPDQLTIRSLLLEKLPRGHRQFLTVHDEKGTLLGEQVLDVSHNELAIQVSAIHPLSKADPIFSTAPARSDASTASKMNAPKDGCIPANADAHSLGRGQPHRAPNVFFQFVSMGITHIGTGYDHLLFLFGLLLVGGSLRSVLQIITSFTCAHSITLALAALNVINVSSRIIEPLIAASIIYVGMDNILRPELKGRCLLTFGFGLIHGCGFASALRELGLGANGTSVVLPLVSFNLGVELGQMAIALLVLPLIWKCRRSPVFVSHLAPVGSCLIACMGGYWLVQRTLL